MDSNEAKCLVVSKVLVADGMMTDDERAFLARMMQTLELDDAARRRVIDLEGLDRADAIVRALPVDERREIVSLLVDASAADGTLSPHELETLKQLTVALGL